MSVKLELLTSNNLQFPPETIKPIDWLLDHNHQEIDKLTHLQSHAKPTTSPTQFGIISINYKVAQHNLQQVGLEDSQEDISKKIEKRFYRTKNMVYVFWEMLVL